MKKIFLTLTAVFVYSLPIASNATVINSIPGGGTSLPFTELNLFTGGPFSENGYTFTSTTTNSVYGYTGGYGFPSNGSWDGLNMVGLNTDVGTMTFTFDDAVSSVLGFLNMTTFAGASTIAIYDESNNLLESLSLNIAVGGGTNLGEYWGFERDSNEIKSFTLSDNYIGMADFRIDMMDSVNVPEPSTLLLMGLGFIGLGISRRKSL